MGGHGAAAARKGWREIDDPETKDEVRSLFLKRGIQRGTYDPRRGAMGWSEFFFGEICEEINRNFRNFVRKFLFSFSAVTG